MKHFLDYIDQTRNAKSKIELFNAFTKGMGNYGYEAVAFHLLTDHSEIGVSDDSSLNNVRRDMVEAYAQADFNGHNPILRHAKDNVGIFEWAEVMRAPNLSAKERECLHFMEEFQYHNGTFITIHGVRGRKAGIGLSTSGKKDGYLYDPDVISSYCNHFYMSYVDLALHNPAVDTEHNLSVKELEILTWIAAGKSDTEIGDIVGVSRHAINMRMRRIFKKLGTTNRIQTSIKAISLGLIQP